MSEDENSPHPIVEVNNGHIYTAAPTTNPSRSHMDSFMLVA